MNQRDPLSSELMLNSLLGDVVGGQSEEAGIDFFAYWQVVLKYRWGILGLTLLVALLSLIYTSTLVPRYQAQATLLFDPPSANNYGTVRDMTAMDAYSTYYRNAQVFRSQQEIMRSRKFSGQVVDHYELWGHMHFSGDGVATGLAEPAGKTGIRKWLPEWLLDLSSGDPVVVTRASDEELKQRYRDTAISAVRAGLTISTEEDIMLIKLGFVSPDPDFAADMANKLADYYILNDLEMRMETFTNATSWLTQRTMELRENMMASELELQDFRERENMVDLEGGASIQGREMEDVFERLTAARKKTQSLELVQNRLSSGDDSLSQLAGSPEMIKYPGVRETLDEVIESQKSIDELRLVYGPKHPRMMDAANKHERLSEKLASAKNLVEVSVSADLTAARAEMQRLGAEFDSHKNSVREIDRKKFKLSSLERNQQADQELYNLFVTRFKELSIGSDVTSPNAQIIDHALVPQAPFWPNKPRLIFMYSAIALFFGVGLAFLREYLDKTIKSPEEVEEKLGVPLLGTLPQLDRPSADGVSAENMFVQMNKSQFSESIRSIRTGVMLSGLDDPHQILAITSTVPGEGKTTVSMNVACALGQVEKVLLIDADMRRAALGPHFGIERNTAGLSDVAAGIKELQDCIYHFEEGGIDILPAGTITPNPQELLSSSRFEQILDQVSQQYDRVVIDTAPVHLVSDPMLVARWASALIYVCRAETTYYQLANVQLRTLEKVGKPILGVVLNGVSEHRASYKSYRRYGGSRDGYGGYGYGGVASETGQAKEASQGARAV